MSRVETAVVLAAGMGTRLEAGGTRVPKGFLSLGGTTLIERSLDLLEARGVRRVVIVTGHRREAYEELRARRPALVTTVHNARYAESGSMVSLACARDLLDAPFLLLESDILFEARALDALLEPGADDLLLCSGFTGADDAVFVESRRGLLVGMSKDRAALGPGVLGELVGITRVSPALLAAMLAHLDALRTTTLQVAYETDALVAAARTRPVRCVLVPDLAWAEVDHAEHLARARELVLPAIRAREGRRAPLRPGGGEPTAGGS